MSNNIDYITVIAKYCVVWCRWKVKTRVLFLYDMIEYFWAI